MSSSTAPIAPGGTIGILGGGQLARMLSIAAARLGLRAHVFCQTPDQAVAEVAGSATVADFEDEAALAAFAKAVDVVTFETENIPVASAEFLAARVPVRPGARCLATGQDRLTEKSFLREAGIVTADFAAVDSLADLEAALEKIGTPAVLKTRRFGYDGKGQSLIREKTQAGDAWEAVNGAPSILEAFVPFECELSVIAARGLDGEIACFDAARNEHEHHILSKSVVPAGLPDLLYGEAQTMARRIAERLDYVGVLGVEMFLVPGGEPSLYVNEIAPRVHNSGHWTIDACTISQFEQHVRTICGWPMGSPARHSDAVMTNLIGDQVVGWTELGRQPGLAIHIYGKEEVRRGRKMGHVTQLFPLGSLAEDVPEAAAATARTRSLKLSRG